VRLPLFIIGLLVIRAGQMLAHEVITTNLTYTRDVSRILARRCLACHAQGSAIPLTNYREVRPWAVAIKEQVLSRAMPPWGAVKGFGDFAPDDGMSQEEILLIAAWVVGGAPQGDPRLLPEQTPNPQNPSQKPPSAMLTVSTRTRIRKPVHLVGLRPWPERLVESTRIVARLPNGQTEPLLWLYRYDPQRQHGFRLRKPFLLPRGTVIEATSELRYSLEIRDPAASREP
jgi:hypothetical protein